MFVWVLSLPDTLAEVLTALNAAAAWVATMLAFATAALTRWVRVSMAVRTFVSLVRTFSSAFVVLTRSGISAAAIRAR